MPNGTGVKSEHQYQMKVRRKIYELTNHLTSAILAKKLNCTKPQDKYQLRTQYLIPLGVTVISTFHYWQLTRFYETHIRSFYCKITLRNCNGSGVMKKQNIVKLF